MKERPILFNNQMVRAILDGRKTQTRRAFYPEEGGWKLESPDGQKKVLGKITSPHPKKNRFGVFIQQESAPGLFLRDLIPCQFGEPGERLWVREAWKPRIAHSCAIDACDCADVWVDYAAGGEGKYFDELEVPDEWLLPKAAIAGNNVPGIHMPRWASRITLEITDVRVERLNAITEKDAKAEGVDAKEEPNEMKWQHYSPHGVAFVELWESINGAGSWKGNPWVWVIEFKRLDT